MRSRLAFLVLALTVLLQSQAGGQCQPAPEAALKKPPVTAPATGTAPQFYDEPQFTVSGVADATNLGGHGSDVVVRTRESLAKDASSLGKGAAPDHPSLAALEATAQQNPADYRIARALASAYADAARYEDSRARILALLERPQLPIQDQADLHHLLGDVEEKRNRPLEAVREYQRAAELDPSEPHLFDWGSELLIHHAAEPAIEVFARGNRLFPSSTRMLIGVGIAWHALGSYERAVQCLSQAADLHPDDPLPYTFLGKMQNTQAAPSADVLTRLERFVRLQPENSLANFYYAVALGKQANAATDPAILQQRRSLLEKAVLRDPRLAAAFVQLGALHTEQGDYPNAIRALHHAIAADPQMEEPHYRLAQIYRRMGEKAVAQQELQKYDQLSKNAKEKVERERHEIQQFVISLRDANSAAPLQP